MPEPAQYNVICVGPGWARECQRKGAPTEAWMCQYAARNKASAVVRYYPKYGGWKILDVRDAQQVHLGANGRGTPVWRGQRRGKRVYPSEDSAVMMAMSMLGTQPSML